MITEKRPNSAINTYGHSCNREAGCLYAVITGRRSVSRRNRASWYLRQLNKAVVCDSIESLNYEDADVPVIDGILSPDIRTEDHGQHAGMDTASDIHLVSITSSMNATHTSEEYSNSESVGPGQQQQFLVTPNTRVLFLSKSIASSIVLDLSPSVVSVSSQNGCVFLDSMFDALKRVLHLLVKCNEIPSSSSEVEPYLLRPKVFVSVIAYTPFVVAKNNQVLVQHRRISSANIDQVLVEIWICLNRLTQEIHDLVGNTCGMKLEFDTTKTSDNVFVFPQPIGGGVIRHPEAILEDIYELGLFSSSLMPRLSRLSMIVISDGLFASTNNLSMFRLKSIAVSFVSLGSEGPYPDACFGYTPYTDLMKFVSKTTQGIYLSHQDLINSSHCLSKIKQVALFNNPLYKLFCWTLHSDKVVDISCDTPRASNFHKFEPTELDPIEVHSEHISRFFCIDQPLETADTSHSYKNPGSNNYAASSHNYHDWRSFRQIDRNLDADFEQVLSCLLREGYLIKNIQFKHKETSWIVARLVLHWRHNLDLEQELTAPYWSNTDPFDVSDSHQLILRPFNTPLYGDTYCEIIVHGSYSFLHNLYCDRRTSKRRSEYRDIAYRQFRQLIDGVLQTHERLQYLSRFYRDSSLSKVPSFLLHGNSLLYEQPHTHKLTSTIENVMDEAKTSEFQEYWQKISCLDTKSWKNLMHIHTLRLVLEHDQPKHKNIHCQNASGRYTHVQCRRALSAISTFIKSYASFALLEDTTYIKFIYNNDDDLREIETSATKGFIIIQINKLLPIVVIYLMFTSGILDSHRVQIVSYLEEQLTKCKLRNVRPTSTAQQDNILKSKTISPSSESCCILIKSPLERMLKVYSRNFVTDYLIHNWAHGLPGSCPYTIQQPLKVTTSDTHHFGQSRLKLDTSSKDGSDSCSADSISRYNLVFGKYLYGIRVVQTILNLPHDLVPSLAANVLSKISAIVVNIRIKQGFHIAFNNSGILNLVVELDMKDHSNEDHASSCLCQYIVFPPATTNSPTNMHSLLNNTSNNSNNNNASSKPSSLNGSLANSECYMKNSADSNPHLRGDNGEIKMIREYWIEQQYGISSNSKKYHKSLENMRYSEVVDHLFLTDSSIFECLLTYELLQLLCDKLSLYHNLDSSLVRSESKTPLFSPTTSTNSSNLIIEQGYIGGPSLPSTLIEGNTRNGNSRVPLLELTYKFSIMKFLDYSQQATLNVLLFKTYSEFHCSSQENLDKCQGSTEVTRSTFVNAENSTVQTNQSFSKGPHGRKMSVDINDSDGDFSKREHRSSYQHESLNTATCTYLNPIYSPSLNHMFLETLHKRLKQMHDKEIKLSDHDLERLPAYLKRRWILSENASEHETVNEKISTKRLSPIGSGDIEESAYDEHDGCVPEVIINWRCFLRKGNQDNLMIILVPATLGDVANWLNFVNSKGDHLNAVQGKHDPVCPIFVFRSSSTMISDHVLSFLKGDNDKASSDPDLSLHFGQPCNYMGHLKTFNDELSNDIVQLSQYAAFNQTTSDDKTLELVHFRAFLRKIKNTVLKSRFSSLNDAYLSELFIHKDDILYYINNVDLDTQKKYHVSSQLKSLTEFIKSYEEYNDSLPKEPGKPCNQLLNSILLQKCGLFINQPIARFNESNPLIKQLHDKKLLFLMRCNYKVELPILEENLAGSTLLSQFIKSSNTSTNANSLITSSMALSSSIHESLPATASSLSKSEGTRLMEMKCGSVGASGSPSAVFASDRPKVHQVPRFGSNSTLNSISNSANDSFILEAFRGSKSCSIQEIPNDMLGDNFNISLRHEAHMAEVLKRTGERKESHHYRRVLKSKGNYSQSHSAIDQALKRVDSLGRLEHFCLTPLLFSPSWRSKLAPVRDHTIESNRMRDIENHYEGFMNQNLKNKLDSDPALNTSTSGITQSQTAQQEAEDRWHQMVCNNYIKEYEQYIQTLGFNSVQIKYQSHNRSSVAIPASATPPQPLTPSAASTKYMDRKSTKQNFGGINSHLSTKPCNSALNLRRGSLSTSNGSLPNASAISTYNTGYLIKFLNSGCLVFKVGFCKPYVYSILYSIEGERFNNSNVKMNMTAFLDELDNIKVTMHLHSFTYDYHLRSMYSYISGRQLTFSPGYHLISFLDDFRKYYQKAPNYARNHILCGEVHVTNLKVTGQQLYNYIITHNSAYNMDVLEMSTSISNIISNFAGRTLITDQAQESNTPIKDLDNSSSRSHANDYVLIEIKREKVRYRDGKNPDIFDCGLLITHDVQSTESSKNSLTLKYFLLLTNQRDLYPKLIHTYENIISLGCHRPIRFGMTELKLPQAPVHKANSTTAQSSGQSDHEDVQSSELQSSGEVSGPQSIISTANSTRSSNSGLQFGIQTSGLDIKEQTTPDTLPPSPLTQIVPDIRVEQSLDSTLVLKPPRTDVTSESKAATNSDTTDTNTQTASSVEDNNSFLGDASPTLTRKRVNSSSSSRKNALETVRERTICDEEITYLGYFSSDEMDMLKFLREKTTNLRMHLEKVVRSAEVHYRRDYLWHKLMQRNVANAKSDDMPLTTEELVQLLAIVEAIDLASLDPQLSTFTTMHINWYMKLLKAFAALKQSSMNMHKIYTVKASKILFLYIDPKCTTAFILLTIDPERCSVELNMLLKDKQECSKLIEKTPTKLSSANEFQQPNQTTTFELDQECQHLINDFINFCATFTWSTLLA